MRPYDRFTNSIDGDCLSKTEIAVGSGCFLQCRAGFSLRGSVVTVGAPIPFDCAFDEGGEDTALTTRVAAECKPLRCVAKPNTLSMGLPLTVRSPVGSSTVCEDDVPLGHGAICTVSCAAGVIHAAPGAAPAVGLLCASGEYIGCADMQCNTKVAVPSCVSDDMDVVVKEVLVSAVTVTLSAADAAVLEQDMAKAKAAFAAGLTAEIGSQATVTLLTFSIPTRRLLGRMLQQAGDGLVIVDFFVEDTGAEAKMASLATGQGTTSLVSQLSTSLTASFPGVAGVSSAVVRPPSTQTVSIDV